LLRRFLCRLQNDKPRSVIFVGSNPDRIISPRSIIAFFGASTISLGPSPPGGSFTLRLAQAVDSSAPPSRFAAR
jgi:hypothetical protein